MSAVIGLINSSLLLVLKNRWGRLFSSDDKVVAIVANVVRFLPTSFYLLAKN